MIKTEQIIISEIECDKWKETEDRENRQEDMENDGTVEDKKSEYKRWSLTITNLQLIAIIQSSDHDINLNKNSPTQQCFKTHK